MYEFQVDARNGLEIWLSRSLDNSYIDCGSFLPLDKKTEMVLRKIKEIKYEKEYC